MGYEAIQSNPIGVVGLGLMGSSIVVALVSSGHKVIALAPISGEKEKAEIQLKDLLRHMDRAQLLKGPIEDYYQNITLVEEYKELSPCLLVLECVIENMDIKKSVYHKISNEVSVNTIIASNTSAIPISQLQKLVPNPERFLGVHWAEPAYMTRFLEVTCGDHTDPRNAEMIMELALGWDKEPTLLNKDIRGFITNRLMYAIYREALSLIEEGHTTIGDADKACRYDMGSWVTLMGIFRRMDFTGVADFIRTCERNFPLLDNRSDVPELIKKIAEENGRGIHNLNGFYPYTEEEAKNWEKSFADFNERMYKLAAEYNEVNLGLTRK